MKIIMLLLSLFAVPLGVCGLFIVTGCAPVQEEPTEADRIRDEIKALMQKKPPAGNVRIEIERLESSARIQQAMSFAGRSRANGALSAWGLSSSWGASSRTTGIRQNQFIVLQPQSEAMVSLVQVHQTPWIVTVPVYRGTVVIGTIQEEVTGSAMRVAVRQVADGLVEVELKPFYYGVKTRGPVEMQTLYTTVVLRNGEPTLIAGSGSSTSGSGGLFSVHDKHGTRQIALVMTATIGE